MQVKTRATTISAIVGAADFQRGVSDFRNGRPFDYDGECTKSAWHYERGRLYAAHCAAKGRPPVPSRHGRRVNPVAISDVANAFKSNSLR